MERIQVPRRMSRKLSNLNHVLKDIRGKLSANWVYYEECVQAIISAIARQEDASAWYEQMQKIVQGVEEVLISHEGVLFLLRELARSETALTNEMPPPPLPIHVQQRQIAQPHPRLRPAFEQPCMSAPNMLVSPLDFRVPLNPAPVSAYLQQPSNTRDYNQQQFSRPMYDMGMNKPCYSNQSFPVQSNGQGYNSNFSYPYPNYFPLPDFDLALWDKYFDKENVPDQGSVQGNGRMQLGQHNHGYQ